MNVRSPVARTPERWLNSDVKQAVGTQEATRILCSSWNKRSTESACPDRSRNHGTFRVVIHVEHRSISRYRPDCFANIRCQSRFTAPRCARVLDLHLRSFAAQPRGLIQVLPCYVVLYPYPLRAGLKIFVSKVKASDLQIVHLSIMQPQLMSSFNWSKVSQGVHWVHLDFWECPRLGRARSAPRPLLCMLRIAAVETMS
jgi:hypothetical protein